jgi:hypothetical protein
MSTALSFDTAPVTSTCYRLTPSDFAFLWDECKRCFYKKVALGEKRPSTPIAKIFTLLDAQQKGFYSGRSVRELSPTLPEGRIECPTGWVKSKPIRVGERESSVWILGKLDAVLAFDSGTFGITDFKTSTAKDQHVPLYARQLHAYALAVENAAPGGLSFRCVERLGLSVIEPVALVEKSGVRVYDTELSWQEVPRDDVGFSAFLGEVLDVLQLPEAPRGNPQCAFCSFARRGW